jgi:hypothetical protein
VIVVWISVVLVAPPFPELDPFVELGPGVGVREATALNVVATEYETGGVGVASTSPTAAQKPPKLLTAAYTLGAAVTANASHVCTALSKALGHHELALT